MKTQTKQQRKDEACEECWKIVDPAVKAYEKKIEEIDNEVEEIIEHKGHKYKLIEEKQ